MQRKTITINVGTYEKLTIFRSVKQNELRTSLSLSDAIDILLNFYKNHKELVK